MRELRVTALQLRAHDRAEFARVWPSIAAQVEQAAAVADLVVMPEGTIPAYVLGNDAVDEAQVERAVVSLREIASREKTVIVAGAALRLGAELRNAGLVIDADGSIAGRCDKIFLWQFDRRWFSPGTEIRPVSTSMGRLGIFVCADGRMPEIARTLVDRGAEILVMPTAWVTSGRDPAVFENAIADLLGRMRAFENGVPFVAANKCGAEESMVLYCGKSQIVDGSGAVVAMASQQNPERLSAVVEIGRSHPRRAEQRALPRRQAPAPGTVRIAISALPLPNDIGRRLEILDCDYAIAPGADEFRSALADRIALTRIDDEGMLDPASLANLRRAGYRAVLWERETACEWQIGVETIARARAGESRMYALVLDRHARRAFVADPDYAILCGTLEGYSIAACTLDLRRSEQTTVVPGTDVEEGLRRVRAMT
jgi:predicted amidohydrolase